MTVKNALKVTSAAMLAAFGLCLGVAIGQAPGDVDGDGETNAIDVQLVINAALGIPIAFDADVNGDGNVNAVDIQLTINAVLGILATVEVPDVTGMALLNAEAEIESAGLLVDSVSNEPSSETAAGHVIRQTPAPGTLVVPGTGVQLVVSSGAAPDSLVSAEDFTYLGAFLLPGGDDRPLTFAYGGNAMTFNPDGDASGPEDGFPGSLFIMGHDRMPYGELPDGNQVAELAVPVPVATSDRAEMNTAMFLQPFTDAAAGLFTEYNELPRAGMEYLNHPATGAKLHLAWGHHFHEDVEQQGPTHAWVDANLAAPAPQGAWYIADASLYSVNDYIFSIPADWAAAHTGNRMLATGRFRDGGWSGQGPPLYAYRPFDESDGSPAPANSALEAVELLHYADSRTTDDPVSQALAGYQHPDEWAGGAWLTTSTGKTAVLFAGTKSTGDKYWYGWVNPAGSDLPCIEAELLGEFTLCRNADGTPCPEADLTECSGHNDYRGWWTTRFEAQFILYDPAQLAEVAAGTIEPWQPQPYASLNIDEALLLNPDDVEPDMLGAGVQRRYRLGAVAYDRANDLLYVLEPFADGIKPVVHVWRVR